MGQFGTYFGLFWVNVNLISGRIASFCLASALFGSLWVVLARFRSPFGSFWVVLASFRSPFGSFWLVIGLLLACFRSLFCSFWVALARFGLL